MCVPVLSVFVDLRPVAAQGSGEQPAARPGLTIVRERLRQIERTFAPRGAAFEAVQKDIARIEAFLDSEVDVATQGIALFVSAPHGLFQTLTTDIPFETHVTAAALPMLFPLARLLGDQETVILALAHTNSARLFACHVGGLRELRRLVEDPKNVHLVHGATAMNQAHYQRHALAQQKSFAREVADQIARLVEEYGANTVLLSGEARGVATLRRALPASIVGFVHELPHSFPPGATPDVLAADLAPVLAALEAENEQSVIERLMNAVRADAMAVVGLAHTRRALQNGQVDTLVVASDAPFDPQTRDELIERAVMTGAAVEVVERNEPLRKVGDVGALLRYRFVEYAQTAPLTPWSVTP
jgi:hypothetical protein